MDTNNLPNQYHLMNSLKTETSVAGTEKLTIWIPYTTIAKLRAGDDIELKELFNALFEHTKQDLQS